MADTRKPRAQRGNGLTQLGRAALQAFNAAEFRSHTVEKDGLGQ
jgi:hypothetical protein